MAPLADLSGVKLDEPKTFKLVWQDLAGTGRELAEEDLDENDLCN